MIVATGSKPRALPGAPFDNERVLDNAGALAIAEVPKRLGVIGAGVIGLELGSVWRRLGAEVTVLEALPAFLGAADEAVAKEARKLFTKQGLDDPASACKIDSGRRAARTDVTRRVHRRRRARRRRATFDRLIVSIGRVPNTDGLSADGGRPAARRARLRRGRRRLPHQPAERLGDRRRRARPDARAQGRGRGRRGRRAHRRPARPRRLQHHALGDLHGAGDRLGRPDRAAAEGRGRRLPGRQFPVRGQRPRARAGRHHRLRQDPRRREDRPRSSACTSSARWPPS